jgi:hypothetical protein
LDVKPVPETPEINMIDSLLVSSSTEGNQWYLNEAEISGAAGQNLVPDAEGSYTVVVTIDGCSSLPSEALVINWMSVDYQELFQKLIVYPVPTEGFIRVEGINQKTHIEMYSLQGRLIDQFVRSDEFDYDISDLPSGTYLMKFIIDDEEKTIRIQRK